MQYFSTLAELEEHATLSLEIRRRSRAVATGKKAASKASDQLQDSKSDSGEKTVAASALSQTPDRGKGKKKS